MKKIVTHDSKFHADDAFAVATLEIYLDKLGEKYKVIRSREEEIIKSGDYVVDVGNIYDEDENRFDHHQESFKDKGFKDIPYSSFGLVWKHYGKSICDNNKQVWTKIRNEFVTIIDANDNGINTANAAIPGLAPIDPEIFVFQFKPKFSERTDENLYKGFLEAVAFAKEFLKRTIADELDVESMREEFETVLKSKKNVFKTDSIKALVLPRPFPWKDFLEEDNDFEFIVFEREDGKWMAQSVEPEKGKMGVKVMKKSWAGLRDQELSDKAGVKDLIFYHKTGYILVGKTKESILKALEKF